MYEQTVIRLGILDRQVGGLAANEPLVAAAIAGEELLKAEAATAEHQRLRYAVAEGHRLAAWTAGDLGLIVRCRYHTHAALDLANGGPLRVTQVLCTAGTAEKNYGDPNEALKLLQIAQIGAGYSDPQPSGQRRTGR